MRHLTRAVLTPITLLLLTSYSAGLLAQTLAGSRASVERQHQEAVRYGYSFLQTGQAVNEFVTNGYLVRVSPSRHMELHAVSYPFARPEVKLFIDRLSAQYYSACGEKLTVTSLTRPINRQPANASSDSVHPTGMAVDLRIPGTPACRSWLEKTLLSLEEVNVLDVTRERRPPHYHVAVYTKPYESYVAGLSSGIQEYIVRRGDTLSRIAQQHATSIAQLRAANGLRGDFLDIGQTLRIPTEVSSVQTSGTLAAADSPATPPPPAVYQVRRGDSLARIAQRYDTTVTRLRAANGIRGDLINIGQELHIPTTVVHGGSDNAVATAITEVEYQVSRGDTLWRIANRYGTSVDMLRQENGLRTDFLDVGQILRVTTSAGNP